MNYKFHYVYRITNKITNMHYYGDRSCNCHPSEDIGIKYFSTSTLKFFIKDQKINTQDYKYKIVKIFETCREDAKQLEVDLHKRFDVKNHPQFINRANQTSSGFKCASVMSITQKKKISNTLKGRLVSQETRNKLSVVNMGHIQSEYTKAKLKEANTGRVISEETRQKISKSNTGKKRSNEFSENLSKIKKGRIVSEETRQKISKSNTGKIHSDSTKIKMSKSHLNNKHRRIQNICIFDNLGVCRYCIISSFKKFCQDFDLPYEPFKQSYNNDSKPLYSSNNAYSKIKNSTKAKFRNWTALIIS